MTNLMLAAALAEIAEGRRVLICEPDSKVPVTRFMPRGVLNATNNPELASRWWRHCPDGNVARATGPGSRDTFDVDVKPAGTGYPAFNRLRAAGILLPPLAIRETPSGGLHCDYPGTSQACASLKLHFIDFKSLGGYVLIPPSVVDGKPYTLISEPNPAAAQLNFSAVRQFLDPPRPIPTAPQRKTTGTGIPGLAAHLATKTRPGRNAALFWAANRAVENGASEAELHELYRDMQFDRHFDERQAARTVADAYRTTKRRSA